MRHFPGDGTRTGGDGAARGDIGLGATTGASGLGAAGFGAGVGMVALGDGPPGNNVGAGVILGLIMGGITAGGITIGAPILGAAMGAVMGGGNCAPALHCRYRILMGGLGTNDAIGIGSIFISKTLEYVPNGDFWTNM